MNKYLFLSIIITILNTSHSQAQDLSSPSGRIVLIETSFGNITIKLYNETPRHRDNFLKLAREGYFDNQLFHRVINGFMIQGGDPNSVNAKPGVMLGQGGPGYSIPAEFNPLFYHKKGALAAARKPDSVNPQKSSSGSQFYIVQGTVLNAAQLNEMVKKGVHATFTSQQIKDYTTIGGAPHLDGSYTVFGEVTEGLQIIDKIAATPVNSYDRPLQDIKYKIKIIE
jgi:peptidyl-prolyl cis-trans isomerase B (cyclophilin B)